MIQGQSLYFQNVTPPGAIVDNASFSTGEIDTVVNGVKYNYLTIIVSLGALDIAVAAMKLQESDTTGTGFTDVTGTVGGTAFTLPGATADNNLYAFFIDLRKRKRFLDLVLTGGDGAAGSYASVLAILSRPNETPVGATAKGLALEVIV